MDSLALRELTLHYKPDPETIRQLKDITLIALVGPSAVGKTTIIEYLTKEDPKIHRVLVDTSREPRTSETQGVDYDFRKKSDMIADMQKGRYAQILYSFNGELYGTRPTAYGNSGFAVMSIRASVVPVFRSLPFKKVKIICIIPPDYETWQQRMQAHDFRPNQMGERLREAKESLSFAYNDHETQLLMNDDLNFACKMCMDLVKDKRLSADELENQRYAKLAIDDVLSA